MHFCWVSFELTILGSSSAVPTRDRNQTSQVLDMGAESVLIDAGESVQKLLIVNDIKPSKISTILISHLHADHYIGLIGLLSSWSLAGRTQNLDIVAPEGLEKIIELQLNLSGTPLSYEINYVYTSQKNNHLLLDSELFSVREFALKHRVPCSGFLIEQKIKELNIDPDMVSGKSLPFAAYRSLKRKEDYKMEDGKVLKWQDFTLPEPKPISYAYFTDTCPQWHLASELKGVTALYHDSTFMHNLAQKAADTDHSTSLQSAEFAAKAEVKKLLLGHFSTRYGNLQPMLEEAQSVFSESYLALEGQKFLLKNTP